MSLVGIGKEKAGVSTIRRNKVFSWSRLRKLRLCMFNRQVCKMGGVGVGVGNEQVNSKLILLKDEGVHGHVMTGIRKIISG